MIARPKAYLNGAYVLYKKYEGAAVHENSSTFARQNTCLVAFTLYNKEPSLAQAEFVHCQVRFGRPRVAPRPSGSGRLDLFRRTRAEVHPLYQSGFHSTQNTEHSTQHAAQSIFKTGPGRFARADRYLYTADIHSTVDVIAAWRCALFGQFFGLKSAVMGRKNF